MRICIVDCQMSLEEVFPKLKFFPLSLTGLNQPPKMVEYRLEENPHPILEHWDLHLQHLAKGHVHHLSHILGQLLPSQLL